MRKPTWIKEPLLFTCSSFPLKFLQETSRLHCNIDKLTTLSVLSPWKPSQVWHHAHLFLRRNQLRVWNTVLQTGSKVQHNLWLSFVGKVFSLPEPYLSSRHKTEIPVKPLFVKCFLLFGCWEGRGRMRSGANSTAKASVTAFYAKMTSITKWETLNEDYTAFSLSAPKKEQRDQKCWEAESFPFWSRKEKTTTTKTSKLHTDFEKVLGSSPGWAVWLNHVFITPRRFIHHSYFRGLWFKYSL